MKQLFGIDKEKLEQVKWQHDIDVRNNHQLIQPLEEECECKCHDKNGWAELCDHCAPISQKEERYEECSCKCHQIKSSKPEESDCPGCFDPDCPNAPKPEDAPYGMTQEYTKPSLWDDRFYEGSNNGIYCRIDGLPATPIEVQSFFRSKLTELLAKSESMTTAREVRHAIKELLL